MKENKFSKCIKNKAKNVHSVKYLTTGFFADSIYIAKTTRSDPSGHGGFFSA